MAEYAFRTAERMGGETRVYGGPKWTVSPVYEGMLKEEMDAAAARHQAEDAAADRSHRRRSVGFEDVRDDPHRVRERILARQNGREGAPGQVAVTDVAALRAAHETGFPD